MGVRQGMDGSLSARRRLAVGGCRAVFQAVAMTVGAVSLGPVTGLLLADITSLAVALAVVPRSRATWLLGWLTAVLFAADFAGAVADRFGGFGPPGASGVSWGDWETFTRYTAVLLHHPWAPLVTLAAIGATAIEVALALLLPSGWQRRWVGKAAAGLCLLYTVTMGASDARPDVAGYAMPVLVGGALLLSATPARWRTPAAQPVDAVSAARLAGDEARSR